ncbi:MAG: CDP-alcohol phosphatidyltransferase family protein [bacterium]|nr:CDP-alcohol phosphatidyltransferase family protein [bacterium]
MDDKSNLTNYVTDFDKSVRGRLCWFITQPIWWLIFPIRWSMAWLMGISAGFVLGHERGQKARRHIYQKILTPANFITTCRFWLLLNAILLFFSGSQPAHQAIILAVAIATDFFDGPAARTNNEVTALGTYMDHIGDWGVVLWVIFLSFWYETVSQISLIATLVVIGIVFLTTITKYRKFRDPKGSASVNISAFAEEELQPNGWGRIQFVCLIVALFEGLFYASSLDPFAFLNINKLGFLVPAARQQTARIEIAFILYFILGGYSIGDALDYSEAKIKKFREKLKKIKNGS